MCRTLPERKPVNPKSNILPFNEIAAPAGPETISVVIPVYNEAANLPNLWQRL